MTVTEPTHAMPARVLRYLTGLVVVVGLAAAPLTGSVEAARRTSSEVIADRAASAVEALDRWQTSHRPADFVQYVRRRDLVAQLTAIALELPSDDLADAWATTDVVKQRSVLAAMSQLGVPYRSYASEEGVGFDCSGLTTWAFRSSGVDIPRVSSDQIRAAEDVELADAEAGDLMYYPGHVGIYLGGGAYVHSPNSGNDVEAAHLPSKSLRFGDIVDVEIDDG